MIGVVVGVLPPECFQTHGNPPSGFPIVDSAVHEPRAGGVPQGMPNHTRQFRVTAGRGEGSLARGYREPINLNRVPASPSADVT